MTGQYLNIRNTTSPLSDDASGSLIEFDQHLALSREACGAAWAAAAATLFGRGPWGMVFGERVANATCAGDAGHVEPHHREHLRALVRANDAALFGGRLAAAQRRVAARGCGGEWTTPAPSLVPPGTPAPSSGRPPSGPRDGRPDHSFGNLMRGLAKLIW